MQNDTSRHRLDTSHFSMLKCECFAHSKRNMNQKITCSHFIFKFNMSFFFPHSYLQITLGVRWQFQSVHSKRGQEGCWNVGNWMECRNINKIDVPQIKRCVSPPQNTALCHRSMCFLLNFPFLNHIHQEIGTLRPGTPTCQRGSEITQYL